MLKSQWMSKCLFYFLSFQNTVFHQMLSSKLCFLYHGSVPGVCFSYIVKLYNIITTVHLLCLGREVAFCCYHDFLLHSHGSWHVQELPELCQICVLVEIRLWNAYVRHYRSLHHWCNNKQNQWTYLVLICRQLRLYHSPLDR